VHPHYVDADSDFYLMRMRIRLFTLIWMRPDFLLDAVPNRVFLCGSGKSGNLINIFQPIFLILQNINFLTRIWIFI
jgi:hypothetical protein